MKSRIYIIITQLGRLTEAEIVGTTVEFSVLDREGKIIARRTVSGRISSIHNTYIYTEGFAEQVIANVEGFCTFDFFIEYDENNI